MIFNFFLKSPKLPPKTMHFFYHKKNTKFTTPSFGHRHLPPSNTEIPLLFVSVASNCSERVSTSQSDTSGVRRYTHRVKRVLTKALLAFWCVCFRGDPNKKKLSKKKRQLKPPSLKILKLWMDRLHTVRMQKNDNKYI